MLRVLCGLLFLMTSLRAEVDLSLLKAEITNELFKKLKGSPQEKPIILLVGGYPGSGKTTLIQALSDAHEISVIAWNDVRQALLDRKLRGSSFDFEVIEAVHENLLHFCIEHRLNVMIDANAHAQNLRYIQNFLNQEPGGADYRVFKICLNPPQETLYKRIALRKQREDLHQGTLSDLERDLKSSKKQLIFSEYSLVIDTDTVSFETELAIVEALLKISTIEGDISTSAICDQ